MATLAVTQRADLTDAQWAVLGPLLPGSRRGRPPEHAKRTLIDGIRWRVRAGAPWRDVPPAYGPWQTVYGLFRRWQRKASLTPKWLRPVVENDAYAAFAHRILTVYARRIATGDIESLPLLTALAADIDSAIGQAITSLHAFGYSWADIAARLGVTRQAAQQRWGAHP